MTDTTCERARLAAPVADILAVLPGMGRVMLTSNAGGATHERIGVVDSVLSDGATTVLSGGAHDAAIDTSAVEAVVVDRSGRMKDKVMPRLEFHDRDGAALFSIIGLDGLEPFEAALKPVGTGAALAPREKPEGDKAVLEDGDVGAGPFEAACGAGLPVTIELRRSGLRQAWHGRIEAVKPAMGFINVMQPDFHLHLRGGAVSGWRHGDVSDTGEVELAALGGDGQAIGLFVRGPRTAFDAA